MAAQLSIFTNISWLFLLRHSEDCALTVLISCKLLLLCCNLQVKVLLKVIREFDSRVRDSEYAVGVIDLLLECIELSCRAG